MRFARIENGIVTQVILAPDGSPADFPASLGLTGQWVAGDAQVGWTYDGAQFAAPVESEPVEPQVPQSVSRAQGKAVLIQQGLWSQVVAFVDAIEDPTEKALAEVALNDTTEWRRDSPFLAQAAQALGLSDAQMDDLFTAAAQVAL